MLIIFDNGQKTYTSHEGTTLTPVGTTIIEKIDLTGLNEEDINIIISNLDNDTILNEVLAKIDKSV